MEILNRKTLEWEKVKIKGIGVVSYLTMSNGEVIEPDNTLAVRGKVNTRGLGYCSKCQIIMTKKEYEKHKRIEAGKICSGCRYLRKENEKIVFQNGEMKYKGTLSCCYPDSYSFISNPLNKGAVCIRKSCSGTYNPIPYNLPLVAFIPYEILTVSQLMEHGWKLHNMTQSRLIFVSPHSNSLFAQVDNNGFLVQFIYKYSKYSTVTCVYNSKEGRIVKSDTMNDSVTDLPEIAIKEIRRLYL